MEDKNLIPRKKLQEFLKDEKFDQDVYLNLQKFAEKMISDIVSRSILLAKHRNSEVLEYKDVSFIIEKEFDYTFKSREVIKKSEIPKDEHKNRIAEIKHNK